jgi:hypothetical protein
VKNTARNQTGYSPNTKRKFCFMWGGFALVRLFNYTITGQTQNSDKDYISWNTSKEHSICATLEINVQGQMPFNIGVSKRKCFPLEP